MRLVYEKQTRTLQERKIITYYIFYIITLDTEKSEQIITKLNLTNKYHIHIGVVPEIQG
jgi:hypothetical protein